MKIIEYARSCRPFMYSYEDYIYSQLKPQVNPYVTNCDEYLGRNTSYFIFESVIPSQKYAVLLEASDGAGFREGCHCIKKDVWQEILDRHEVTDFIVFKMQWGKEDIFNRHFAFPDKTHPLGYFTDYPSDTYHYQKQTRYNSLLKKKDIDFLWAGTVNYKLADDKWPEDINIKYWASRERVQGYKALEKIKERRPEWNIVITDKPSFPKPEYMDLVMRSKICLELPGIGWFTTRFFENLMLGKCIMGRRLPHQLPYELKEDVHYISIGDDYEHLEDYMESYINDDSKIKQIENNVQTLQPYLTHKYAWNNMSELIYNMVASYNL